MPSTAQKRTIILAVVIVACTLVILHNSQVYKFKQSTVDSVKNVIHFIPKKVQYLMWPNENTIPDTSTLQQWTLDQLSDLYFKYVNTLQVFCPVKKVYGGVKTGWYTCDVMRETNSKPCVSYVIASNEKSINNNFFKELNQDYQCERNIIMNSTMAAAQSSTEIGGNSPVGTLKSKGNVDYMAVDVGGGETLLLSWMLTNGLLKNVHQLFVSFHRISADSKTSDYLEHLQILRALFAEGFRTFHFARNIQCLFKGNAGKTGCYTLYM
ncbi:uncharacterized protein LOC132563570, partial [Ylistrum balloti]|uniref:uncharacterized protein LOC132563570 n=1 Tax=Ylistrum balloti TaxID=509963 RepID=UPI002905CD62